MMLLYTWSTAPTGKIDYFILVIVFIVVFFLGFRIIPSSSHQEHINLEEDG
jgi:hypothetical protein